MTEYEFEVGVIGAGPAGLAAAYAARALGKNVVILEDYLWGGTCPNYGCDPKKILLAAVEEIHRQLALQNLGLRGLSTIDWSALMGRTSNVMSTQLNPVKYADLMRQTLPAFMVGQLL